MREWGLESLVSLLSQTLHGSTAFPGMGIVKRGITPCEYSVVYWEDVSLVVGKPGLESCFCPLPGLSPRTSYFLLCCLWNMSVVMCYPVTNTVTIHWIWFPEHCTWARLYAVCSASQSCPTLYGPVGCSPPGSAVHGIFQARILEWLPFPPPGDLPDPKIEPTPLALSGRFSTTEPSRKPSSSPYPPSIISCRLLAPPPTDFSWFLKIQIKFTQHKINYLKAYT